MNILQNNLNLSQEAQDLAIQTAREREVCIIVISKQNRDLYDTMWFKVKRGNAAIYVCKNRHYRAREVISRDGYVGVALGQLAIFSDYIPTNVADVLVELDLAELEEHIQKRKGSLILVGDSNAKARVWTRGPRDPRGDLPEEMMAAYNLVVANQLGVHSYEKGIARSVLDLLFTSPEVTNNISTWEVLDAESHSDHRYISTKLLGKQNQRRKYKTKGGWSLRRMKSHKFLQRISAANLEGSATAEQISRSAYEGHSGCV